MTAFVCQVDFHTEEPISHFFQLLETISKILLNQHQNARARAREQAEKGISLQLTLGCLIPWLNRHNKWPKHL